MYFLSDTISLRLGYRTIKDSVIKESNFISLMAFTSTAGFTIPKVYRAAWKAPIVLSNTDKAWNFQKAFFRSIDCDLYL